MASLYERIGGIEAVELFYQKVMNDTSVNSFFANSNMKKQSRKLKQFLIYAFGGVDVYSGKNMREAHANLVDKGLNITHFECVAAHLKNTLKELQVSDELIGEVLVLVSGTKDDVLGL